MRRLDALVGRLEGKCWHDYAWKASREDGAFMVTDGRCSKCGTRKTVSEGDLFPLDGQDIPAYSTDMNAALGALEKFGHDGVNVLRETLASQEEPGSPWAVTVVTVQEDRPFAHAEHANPATALCIVLLRAAGVAESEITEALGDEG